MSKDMKHSYAQVRWEQAAAEWERMSKWMQSPYEKLRGIAEGRLLKLEAEYPVLKSFNKK